MRQRCWRKKWVLKKTTTPFEEDGGRQIVLQLCMGLRAERNPMDGRFEIGKLAEERSRWRWPTVVVAAPPRRTPPVPPLGLAIMSNFALKAAWRAVACARLLTVPSLSPSSKCSHLDRLPVPIPALLRPMPSRCCEPFDAPLGTVQRRQMVGIFALFSAGRTSHRRTKSAAVSSQNYFFSGSSSER
ncbi:hypothetical protein B296_00036003 [Ensete ventricosum]|uniref:Uncharacterized protein n=1 Tax=Ensete ventricosum TaxID=4639 RepID=A0A427A3Z4_ENSVE|nr:hypothetical protein B296_00036003 [Ensete ventricosum]